MKNFLIVPVLVLLLTGQGCSFNKENSDTETPVITPEASEQTMPVDELSIPAQDENQGEINETVPETIEPGQVLSEPEAEPIEEPNDEVSRVKSFNVVARQWEFVPSTIRVNEGDTVIIDITSEDVEHGIKISAFGVREDLKPGQKTRLEFVADKAGTYTYFCNIFCGEGHGGMKGTLIVQ